MLSGIDLRVRMGMFEEELTPHHSPSLSTHEDRSGIVLATLQEQSRPSAILSMARRSASLSHYYLPQRTIAVVVRCRQFLTRLILAHPSRQINRSWWVSQDSAAWH